MANTTPVSTVDSLSVGYRTMATAVASGKDLVFCPGTKWWHGILHAKKTLSHWKNPC
jgi:hypothetical protein